MMTSLTFLFVLALTSSCSAVKTHFVYWNSTNPIFRIDNTDHIIDVNEDNLPWEYDQLHLVCPQNSMEQHVIYSVPIEDFNNCRVSSPRPKIVAICKQQENFKYFTITFRSFSPTPGGMEFRPGQSYYLISTSTKTNLHRRVGGYCATHNMRIIFKIAESPKTNSVGGGMVYNSPLYRALRTSTSRPPTTSSTDKPPVYYYRGRTPAVHSSDYIYYYSPRDLVKLKLAARKQHQEAGSRSRELLTNEIEGAEKLTSSSTLLTCSCLPLLLPLLHILA